MLKTRKASYNGIDFNVLKTEITGGLRQSQHQFNNNKTILQQHGAKNRTYTLSALHFGIDSIKQSNNLIDQLEKSKTGTLIHPDYGELSVGFDTFSTGVDTKRNMVITRLNFLQDSETNLFNIDFERLLYDTIDQALTTTINATLEDITKSPNVFATILDFQNHVNPTITPINIESILTNHLKGQPATMNSKNLITQTFDQQHQALFVAKTEIGKKYNTIAEFVNNGKNINEIFNNPLITNSAIANDFYHLKSVVARQLMDNNINLPQVKTYAINSPVPNTKLSHQLGDEVANLNNPIHPLFGDDNINYVS